MAKTSPGLGCLGDEWSVDRGDVSAGPVEQVARQQRAALGGGAGLADERRAGAVGLEAAAVAAPAQDSAGHDPHVADLGGDPEGAAVQLAVEDDAAADAGADGDQEEVVDVLAGAEGELAPRRGVGVVLHHDRQVDARLQLGLEVEVAPREVGGEQDVRACRCRRTRPRRSRRRRRRAWSRAR